MLYKRNWFSRFASQTAHFTGNPLAFSISLSVILIWLITGPLFHYSDTWQLVINTGTTIVTFLMVFLIQNTQNRDNHAIQLKLAELIRAMEGAHNSLLDIEELTDEELLMIKSRFARLAQEAREEIRQGKIDTNRPEFKSDE